MRVAVPRRASRRRWRVARDRAVCGQGRRRVGYPTPVGRCTLGRVARPAQHRAVRDVERRTTTGERYYVINGQVRSRVGGPLVARAPVAALATPGAQHAGAEMLPGPCAVEGVVPAAVGLPGVFGAAASEPARDDAAHGAELHPRIVGGVGRTVYSPAVLGLRSQSLGSGTVPADYPANRRRTDGRINTAPTRRGEGLGTCGVARYPNLTQEGSDVPKLPGLRE